ncbi:11416_t:CDS:10 [Entrophospora sp. SA101]|nr:11416_t:CDS:10 [Entrophospora sp. SA101]
MASTQRSKQLYRLRIRILFEEAEDRFLFHGAGDMNLTEFKMQVIEYCLRRNEGVTRDMMDDVILVTEDGNEVTKFANETSWLKLKDSFRNNEPIVFVTKQSNNQDSPFSELNVHGKRTHDNVDDDCTPQYYIRNKKFRSSQYFKSFASKEASSSSDLESTDDSSDTYAFLILNRTSHAVNLCPPPPVEESVTFYTSNCMFLGWIKYVRVGILDLMYSELGDQELNQIADDLINDRKRFTILVNTKKRRGKSSMKDNLNTVKELEAIFQKILNILKEELKNPFHFYEIDISLFKQLINNINNIKNVSSELQDFQEINKSSIEVLSYLIMIAIDNKGSLKHYNGDDNGKVEDNDECEKLLIEALSQIDNSIQQDDGVRVILGKSYLKLFIEILLNLSLSIDVRKATGNVINDLLTGCKENKKLLNQENFFDIPKLASSMIFASDYELQLRHLEIFFRICPKVSEDRLTFAAKVFVNYSKLINKFLNIKANDFEEDTRKFLNEVNSSNDGVTRTPKTFKVSNIKYNSTKLLCPEGKNYFYVDFNKWSISLNIKSLEFNESVENETIDIKFSKISSWTFEKNLKESILILCLNEPLKLGKRVSSNSSKNKSPSIYITFKDDYKITATDDELDLKYILSIIFLNHRIPENINDATSESNYGKSLVEKIERRFDNRTNTIDNNNRRCTFPPPWKQRAKPLNLSASKQKQAVDLIASNFIDNSSMNVVSNNDIRIYEKNSNNNNNDTKGMIGINTDIIVVDDDEPPKITRKNSSFLKRLKEASKESSATYQSYQSYHVQGHQNLNTDIINANNNYNVANTISIEDSIFNKREETYSDKKKVKLSLGKFSSFDSRKASSSKINDANTDFWNPRNEREHEEIQYITVDDDEPGYYKNRHASNYLQQQQPNEYCYTCTQTESQILHSRECSPTINYDVSNFEQKDNANRHIMNCDNDNDNDEPNLDEEIRTLLLAIGDTFFKKFRREDNSIFKASQEAIKKSEDEFEQSIQKQFQRKRDLFEYYIKTYKSISEETQKFIDELKNDKSTEEMDQTIIEMEQIEADN